MPQTCGLNVPMDDLEIVIRPEQAVKVEFCVLRSPLNGQYVVARPGEMGTAGWQSLHGPDTSDGCWAWIHSKPRHALRF